MVRFCGIALVLNTAASTAKAFVQQPPALTPEVTTQLYGNTKSPPSIPLPKDVSSGEESRLCHRTVYTHDDWVKHRSPDRFFQNIVTTTASGVYKSVGREVLVVTFVATFVMIWNMLTAGYTDLEGVKHEALINNLFLPPLTLPLIPFNLATSSLGLFLGTFFAWG
jgi:ion channel-forming bestrophin family protein